MAKQKAPVIVAELGRPETAEETAARKARNSYLYKKRKTVNNLVYSLLVSLGLLLVIVLLVPRGTGDYLERNVDVASLAKDATTTAGQPLAVPQLGQGWLAKQAQLRFDKDELVTYWYIGYTTPVQSGQKVGDYAAILQGTDSEGEPAGKRWVQKMLENKKQTGEETFAGHTWAVYDHREDNADSSNVLTAYVTQIGQATLIVHGTAAASEIKQLATSAVSSLSN